MDLRSKPEAGVTATPGAEGIGRAAAERDLKRCPWVSRTVPRFFDPHRVDLAVMRIMKF
jgi:hypothetical protein